MIIIGIDPGLIKTGWGIINFVNSKISYIDSGLITPSTKETMEKRLLILSENITEIIKKYEPQIFALEETFVNKNPATSLILGQARGAIMLTAALNKLKVISYTPNQIKKTVCGDGHADKEQIIHMVKLLIPATDIKKSDIADALATALCAAFNFKDWNHKLL